MSAPAIDAWHELVRTRNPAGLDALLADDAVFVSPVVHAPQVGKAVTKAYLTAAFTVFLNPTFRYVREIVGATDAMLEFETTIDGVVVNGVDIIRWNHQNRIVEFKVMVRPLKGIHLIHERMAALLANASPAAAARRERQTTGIGLVSPAPEIRLQAFDPGAHAAILREWLHRPHVARWWGDPESTWASVREWPVESCAMIEADGIAVGYICWRTPPEGELEAAGLADLPGGLVDIDLFLGEPALLGRGLGPRALELLLARLRENPLVRVAGVGTAVANDRAVRSFEKAGFRTLREFEDPEFGRCRYLVADVFAGRRELGARAMRQMPRA